MTMQEIFNEITNGLKANLETIPHVHVNGKFSENHLCPLIQFIRVDFIDEKDFPHNIAENSVYVTFEIDLAEKKMEVFTFGHIWLSENDCKNTYLCMAGLKDICKFFGLKWMRKTSYKTSNDAVKKLTVAANNALDAVKRYTNGVYPYKKGVVDIYPSREKGAA